MLTIRFEIHNPNRFGVRDSGEIGIHILQPDSHELLDAIDVALRDNYPAIYVYSGMSINALSAAIEHFTGPEQMYIEGNMVMVSYMDGEEFAEVI